jgi:hypothetical protein
MADGTRRYPVIGYESVPKDEWRRLATLVESVRTAAGPRQKHVAYLGSIKEGDERAPVRQAGFWASADEALDRLDLGGDERAQIEAALGAVVPRPTDEAVEAAREDSARSDEAFRAAAEEQHKAARVEHSPSLDRVLRERRVWKYIKSAAAARPDGPEARFLRELRAQEAGEAGEAD